MQGHCLLGPSAGEGASEGSPGPTGTAATPGHSRREEEGVVWVRRVRKDSGLSPKVQSRGPSFPLQIPLSGPRALGLGTSLRSVKSEEECSKSSLQKIKSEVINTPASRQRLPSTAPSPGAPLGPSSRLRLAVSRPGVLHRDMQSPWKKQQARSSPGPAVSGWETLLVPLRL